MFRYVHQRVFLAGTVGALALLFGFAPADDKQAINRERIATLSEKTSGVIVKVEPPEQDRFCRLTINTDVSWRDFVRDQSTGEAKAALTGTAKAAANGRDSVATEGHPRAKQLLVNVTVDARTEITLRYRSSTNAIGEGAPTPEAVAQAAERDTERPAAKPLGNAARRQALKPRSLEPSELKPGLWVEVDYRHSAADKHDRAQRIRVMRPVGGPDTSPDKEKPNTAPGR
jgi:hypothetical protein